ncbi:MULTISPECIES: phage terminase large subunit [unclassified Ruegeria]|uniref:phage terminase large subunit n=1 Tax=unclassified Ruegeria TaxID=2625375 RepID=UPI0014919477|nr:MULTISPECIES: phage terminase large subunit [unclassified Ruegeria]NOD36629.1 phage terminase large subunit [Ruegeria sp. HKCCD7296]NOE43872.1 phage terminase large subunit [Ruegeria sp. HKCCD7319]
MTPHHDLVRASYVKSLYLFVVRAFGVLNPGDEFVDGYYLRVLCQILTQVAEGKIKRLIITLPPRHLKSQIVSVALPAWLLGRNPTEKIVCASYNSSLANDFGRQTRVLMQSQFYRTTFPKTVIDPNKSAADEFYTLAKGRRFATSVGGTLTGVGGGYLFFDDLMKAEDAESLVKRDNCHDWFRNTAASRLNNPKTGAIVIVAQRLHVDDLVGRLLPSGDWTHLNLPAIATETQELSLCNRATWTLYPGDFLHPERMTHDLLEERRRELGSRAFEAQYQQSPALPGGNLIRLEWFGTYKGAPKPNQYEAIVQSWDTASVPGVDNDYSVCTTWGLINDTIDLLDVHRAQYHYADLLRAARTLRAKWQPKLIVVEKAGVGFALGNDLLNDGLRDVQGLDPKGDKMQRLSLQAAKIEAGQVRLPESAPWLEQFLTEIAEAPDGRYDDQLDSVSQMLRTLDKKPWQLRKISRYKI